MQVKFLISFLAAIILFAGAVNTQLNTLIIAAQMPAACKTEQPAKSQAPKPLQKCNVTSYCGPSISSFNGIEHAPPLWCVICFRKQKGNTPVINNYHREYSNAVWQPPDVLLFSTQTTLIILKSFNIIT